MKRILFIVENDYFPRDARVYNECCVLAHEGHLCYVIAPKNKSEKLFEIIENNIRCFRFPHYEASSILGLPFEYINALFWIFIYSVFITIFCKVKVLHVANPPDFIIPVLSILKIFSVDLIFDIHDLSVETFKAKLKSTFISKLFIWLLLKFEKYSVTMASNVITTNESIRDYILNKYTIDRIYVVRNSNYIRFNSIKEVEKSINNVCVLGYFGVINDDYAAGYQNLIELAVNLKNLNFQYRFDIIGNGSGLLPLKKLVLKNELTNNFNFYGYVELNKSFTLIKNFDFGIVPWPKIDKNNLHTAMKVMDYMCCAVPVCSLNLKEQMISTTGIGILTDNFKLMAKEIVNVYTDKFIYQELRNETLLHFNTKLAWELQKKNLIQCYK